MPCRPRLTRLSADNCGLRAGIDAINALPPYPGLLEDQDYDKMSRNCSAWQEAVILETSQSNHDEDAFAPDDWDPRGYTAQLQRDIAVHSQQRAEALESQGRFLAAAKALAEVLVHRRNDALDGMITFEEEAELEENRANLLMRCPTVHCQQEAVEVLTALLRKSVGSERDEPLIARQARLARIEWKIGQLYADGHKLGDQRDLLRGKDYLRDALDKLMTIKPFPHPLVPEVARLLVAVLVESQAPLDGRLAERIRTDIGGRILSATGTPMRWDDGPRTLPSPALKWCEQLGYTVESSHFRFDVVADELPSPLHLAARGREKDIITEMLGEVENINVTDSSGTTPLMEVAKTRSSDIAKVLLDHGADMDLRDSKGRTALHLVLQDQDARYGIGIATLFLDHMEELVNMTDNKGQSALYMACAIGHQHMVDLLLERHADPNVPDQFGRTPLHVAIDANDHPRRRLLIIEALLAHDAIPDVRDNLDNTPLCLACFKDNAPAVAMLLGNEADVNLRGKADETPLIVATKRRNLDIVTMLVGKGALAREMDAQGRDALHYAKILPTPEIHLAMSISTSSRSNRSSVSSLPIRTITNQTVPAMSHRRARGSVDTSHTN